MSNNSQEIQKRRIFGIISHPDAGKTTLTEKLLLHGGAIREAGTVKARGKNKFAKSDWMENESLIDFLDATDHSKTIEGYPAPLRAVIVANV